MKKIIFLYCIFFIPQCFGDFVETEKIPCIKKNEKILRRMLYRSYARDNAFYKKKCSSLHYFEVKDSLCSCELFSNIDFFITILEDHIKKLERKISHPKRFFQSKPIYKGLFFLSLGAISSTLNYLFFTNVSWPKKEDYLEKITDLEKAHDCAWKNREDFGMRAFLKMESEWDFEERFQYLEVYHIAKHSSDESNYLSGAITLPLSACYCIINSLWCFNKFYTSTRRHVRRLRRDKALLAILKKEKYNLFENRSRWHHF